MSKLVEKLFFAIWYLLSYVAYVSCFKLKALIFFQIMIFFVTVRVLQICGRGVSRGFRKFNDYVYLMSHEYKEVLTSILVDCKQKPVKSSIISCGLACLLLLYQRNPSYNKFLSQLNAASCDLFSVGEPIRSPYCQQRLGQLSQMHRLQQLNYTSFVLFSILWHSDQNRDLKSYISTCKFLAIGWNQLFSENRIVDFGIGGRWILIDTLMIDYDINELEWKNSN